MKKQDLELVMQIQQAELERLKKAKLFEKVKILERVAINNFAIQEAIFNVVYKG